MLLPQDVRPACHVCSNRAVPFSSFRTRSVSTANSYGSYLRGMRQPYHGWSGSQTLRCCSSSSDINPPDDASEAHNAHYRAAAKHVVDKYIRDGMVVGFGTGSMVNLVIEEVGQRVASSRLQRVTAVPASTFAATECAFHGLTQSSVVDHDALDVVVEEADEVDIASQHAAPFIIGRYSEPQQPQLTKARLLFAKAQRLVLLLQSPTQGVTRLSAEVPVVIEDGDWENTAEEIDDIFLGDAEVWRRPTTGTSNPRGGDNPYVSAEGHNILDIKFYGALKLFGDDQATYKRIYNEVMGVAGVVTMGLIVDGPPTDVIAASLDEPKLLHSTQHAAQQSS